MTKSLTPTQNYQFTILASAAFVNPLDNGHPQRVTYIQNEIVSELHKFLSAVW